MPSAESLPGRGRKLLLSPSVGFLVRAVLWFVLLFGVLRVPWVQQNLLLPLAALQGTIAFGLVGSNNSLVIDLSCTGADPMALVVGAILAFGGPWSRRLIGSAAGLGLILVLNTLRIGTLALVADRREMFDLLHLYLWPAFLIVAAAGYVFYWMSKHVEGARPGRSRQVAFVRDRRWRFIGLMSLLVLLFFLSSGWIMSSEAVLMAARWATALAAAVMAVLGVSAEVSGNYLTTAHGRWVVTQACVATPLIPVYLAAILSLSLTPARRALALLAAVPLFVLLGTGRLLVLALPPALVGSHNVAIHAFYQILAGVVIVALVALRTGRPRAPAEAGGGPSLRGHARALRALAGGVGCGAAAAIPFKQWLWPVIAGLPETIHLGHGYSDDQGALLLMPAFQVGLWVALWLALRRSLRERWLVGGMAVLAAGQALVVVGLGELAVHFAIELPIAGIRAFALATPVLVAWWPQRSRGTDDGEMAITPVAQTG